MAIISSFRYNRTQCQLKKRCVAHAKFKSVALYDMMQFAVFVLKWHAVKVYIMLNCLCTYTRKHVKNSPKAAMYASAILDDSSYVILIDSEGVTQLSD